MNPDWTGHMAFFAIAFLSVSAVVLSYINMRATKKRVRAEILSESLSKIYQPESEVAKEVAVKIILTVRDERQRVNEYLSIQQDDTA